MGKDKIKLSKKMIEAIRLMREGYELGHNTGYFASVWLQHGGCGNGGNHAKISFSTFFAIQKRNLVEPKPNQSQLARPLRYHLTELGKTIEL